MICAADIVRPTIPGWSKNVEDNAWDAFLETNRLGHFQQSSLWARAKQVDGWQADRRVVVQDGKIIGGFQVLVKSMRAGRVGYIYKGPVIPGSDSVWVDDMMAQIAEFARAGRIRAIIVQPPDYDTTDAAHWMLRRFQPNQLVRTISATLVMDLTGGLEQVWSRMRKTTRKEIRQAIQRGVEVFHGNEEHISHFFSLMCESCKRQHTVPAPASVKGLEAVWKAFQASGKVKLFLARCEGEIVAGMLCLSFGKRVVGWKKGWSGSHGDRNTNQLVAYEALKWAVENGYDTFDYDAIDRTIAESLLRGETLTDKQKSSRYFFALGYGGQPLILPPAHVYVSNPIIRYCYGKLAAGGYFQTRWANRLKRSQ